MDTVTIGWIILKELNHQEKDIEKMPMYGLKKVFGTLFSADMEKVNMLPRLPGVKNAVFTRRIVMYHATFAPLVPSIEARKHWKEAGKVPEKLKVLGDDMARRNSGQIRRRCRKYCYQVFAPFPVP